MVKDKQVQKAIRMNTTIFKLFIWRGIWGHMVSNYVKWLRSFAAEKISF